MRKAPIKLLQTRHPLGQVAAGLLGMPGTFGGTLPGLADRHDVAVDVMGHRSLPLGGRGDLPILIDNDANSPEDVASAC